MLCNILGVQVKLAEKLPHVQSLCIHEMVTRAYKHLLRAVITTVRDDVGLAASIAVTLNVMLGGEINETNNIWRWLQVFVEKRFGWKFENQPDIRKFAILRGLCHKVCSNLMSSSY